MLDLRLTPLPLTALRRTRSNDDTMAMATSEGVRAKGKGDCQGEGPWGKRSNKRRAILQHRCTPPSPPLCCCSSTSVWKLAISLESCCYAGELSVLGSGRRR